MDEAEGIRAVQDSIELGINFIDVSPFYGLTKSETVLGKALKAVPRDKYFLATKCGRYGQEMGDFDFSAKRITASIDQSLGRMGVDHVDLLHAHDIEFGEFTQIIHETIPALRQIQKSGKALFIGVTGLPLAVLRRAVEAAPLDAILSYCHYSLNDTALADLAPLLKSRGVGAINASPLSMGLLSQRGAPAWHPAPTRRLRAAEPGQPAEHAPQRRLGRRADGHGPAGRGAGDSQTDSQPHLAQRSTGE